MVAPSLLVLQRAGAIQNVRRLTGGATLSSAVDNPLRHSGNTTTTAIQALPTGTISVASTRAFSPSGTILIVTGAGDQTVTYTGKTEATFTGCTGGTGSTTVGGTVKQGNTTTTAVQTLPTGTINISSSAGFPASGTVLITTTLGVQGVTYTGIGATTLTGCGGGTGDTSIGGAVAQAVIAAIGTTANASEIDRNAVREMRGFSWVVVHDSIVNPGIIRILKRTTGTSWVTAYSAFTTSFGLKTTPIGPFDIDGYICFLYFQTATQILYLVRSIDGIAWTESVISSGTSAFVDVVEYKNQLVLATNTVTALRIISVSGATLSGISDPAGATCSGCIAVFEGRLLVVRTSSTIGTPQTHTRLYELVAGSLTQRALTTTTTIAVASDGATLPQATVNVASTTGFPNAGAFTVVSTTGTHNVTYTGKTGTSFTGCAGGTGVINTGNAVVMQLSTTPFNNAANAMFQRPVLLPITLRTLIAAGSNGAALPQATIFVDSAVAFPTSGVLRVRTTNGIQLVTYTGKTPTTFTGCAGGTGTMSTGGVVYHNKLVLISIDQLPAATQFNRAWEFAPSGSDFIATDITVPFLNSTLRTAVAGKSDDGWFAFVDNDTDPANPAISLWYATGGDSASTVSYFEYVDSATEMLPGTLTGLNPNSHALVHNTQGGGHQVNTTDTDNMIAVGVPTSVDEAGEIQFSFIAYGGGTLATTIAAGSNGATLPAGTINVASTTGFPSSGTIYVITSAGTQTVTYTGTTPTTFTGCAGGTGTMSTGGAVTTGKYVRGWFSTSEMAAKQQMTLTGTPSGGSIIRNQNQFENITPNGTTTYTGRWKAGGTGGDGLQNGQGIMYQFRIGSS